MSDDQFKILIQEQQRMFTGEAQAEEVKQEQPRAAQQSAANKPISLFEVAKVNWDYFSPENVKKATVQNSVSNIDKAR